MNWFQEYKSTLKMAEVEEVIDLILYRPIAFLLVISIYNTRIKPDHLTLAAMMSGITAGFFYAYGSGETCIAGALFYLLFNILDCSDGQLARIKKNGSAVGRILDGMADYIAAIAVYSGIIIGYSNYPGQPTGMMILVILAGISILFQESLVDYFRTRFLDIVLMRKNTFSDGIDEFRTEYVANKKRKDKVFSNVVLKIYLKYTELQLSLISKKKRIKLFNPKPEDFFKRNRTIIRFWVLMGPSAKITTLIICSFFCRFDIFFWVVICGFNVLALILWIIQQQVDKSFETEEK